MEQAEILNEHNLEKYSFYMHTDMYCNLQSTTNTFQGILITDGTYSYAVFIYECGGMEWGGGEIGWRDGSSKQVSHPLSGSSNSNDIGCLYSETYSAIVYRLHCKCLYYYIYSQFEVEGLPYMSINFHVKLSHAFSVQPNTMPLPHYCVLSNMFVHKCSYKSNGFGL